MTAMKGEQVFLLDMLLDGAMLLAAMRLLGRRARPMRLLLSALLGACAARAAASLDAGCAARLWLPVALGMMAVAGGRAALRRPLRSALVLLAAAGLLGGTVQALLGATGSLPAALLLGLAAFPVTAAAAMRARRAGGDVQRVRIRVRYRGREAAFDAMVDSGNCLRDYLTHRPVIVAPEKLGRARLGLEGEALRPIFADTAGGRQMMWCLLPEQTVICFGHHKKACEAMLALSPGLGGDAPALVPAALLGGAGEQADEQSETT